MLEGRDLRGKELDKTSKEMLAALSMALKVDMEAVLVIGKHTEGITVALVGRTGDVSLAIAKTCKSTPQIRVLLEESTKGADLPDYILELLANDEDGNLKKALGKILEKDPRFKEASKQAKEKLKKSGLI